MRSEEPGPLADRERALLEGFLRHEFAGVEKLREQVRHLQAKRGCECGCGTVDFVARIADLPASSAANPVPVDAVIVDPEGRQIGGLILLLRDGVLDSLEVFSHSEPLPLPRSEHVRWVV